MQALISTTNLTLLWIDPGLLPFFYLSEASGAHLLVEGKVFRTANCVLVFLVLLQSPIIHIVRYHYNDSGPSTSQLSRLRMGLQSVIDVFLPQ